MRRIDIFYSGSFSNISYMVVIMNYKNKQRIGAIAEHLYIFFILYATLIIGVIAYFAISNTRSENAEIAAKIERKYTTSPLFRKDIIYCVKNTNKSAYRCKIEAYELELWRKWDE